MKTEEREQIIQVLNDTNTLRKFENLYFRWQDENQYEDFNDYTMSMMKSMPTPTLSPCMSLCWTAPRR